MKNIFLLTIYLTLILFLSSNSSIINTDSQTNSVKSLLNKTSFLKKNKNYVKDNKRSLTDINDDGFTEIKIFIDKTYIKYQNLYSTNTYTQVIKAIEKCVNTIQKLIKVKKKDKIKFSDTDLIKLEINSNQIDKNLLPTSQGIEADLIIIPKFIENNSIIALGKPVILDSSSKRPIGSILLINRNINTNKNSENYIESIILHQFTHILGFLYTLFNAFPIGISNVIKIENETRTNQEKKFIITPKVVSYAKKYFNCDSITGVELENGGGYDGYDNSHWEARILLGEYMNSETHTPEQTISGFTLALLEDSGWYKVNYYTGGLMRYGKNQSCDFLYKDCEVNDDSKNYFKNDLFTKNSYYGPTCTSGRQSRSYNFGKDGVCRGLQFHGKEIADYCFVSDLYEIEEKSMYYVGSCRRGGGEYGQRIIYNSGRTSKNGDIPEIFGEKISSNSFCVLSSAIPTLSILNNKDQFNYYKGITHPMCYPIFCSEKSLTIQVYNQYIVCPREGGIVQIKGEYIGYIYCPDYNLICTGTVMCNDMFECVEKNSLEKNDTFNYDYEIKTSQIIINENELTQSDISIGYELSEKEDGKCPEHCNQCKENKKCFICENSYLLIGTRENDNNPIICSQNYNLSNYYKNKNDNTFYLCIDNCLKCNSTNDCIICDSGYKLTIDNSTCEEKVLNCKIYDINFDYCEECKEEYYLLNDDKVHCYNESIEKDNYFTENEGKTYISCDSAIPNCMKCNNRNYCIKCKDGFSYEQESNICNLKIPHCQKFDIDYELCKECDIGFYLLDDNRTKCNNESIDTEKYFTEDNGKTYIKCEQVIENCIKCQGRNSCTECIKTHKIGINENKCEQKIPNCKIFDSNYETCIECKENYYFLNNDFTHCLNTSVNNSYFTEDNGKTYLSCEIGIQNCIKCKERNYCLYCKQGYILGEDNSKCISIKDPNIICNININIINDKDINFLKKENINILIQKYISNNNNLGQVEHYINNIYNYSITIFKYSECTKNLLNLSSYYLNTNDIIFLYGNGFLINCFITYNFRNFINFYKSDNGEIINMEVYCPQCLELNYNIINNFTNDFLNYYNPLIIDKIIKENIDVFSDENHIVNDKCNYFEYAGINIPITIRKKYFYINLNKEEFLCTDQFCKINSKNIEKFTADCECKINYELDYLLDDINKYNNESIKQYKSFKNSINSLDVFSCFFQNIKKIFTNFSFYFSLSCELIEIVSFIFYVGLKQQINLQKYSSKNNNDNNSKDKKSNNLENKKRENNIISTGENNVSSIEKFTSNPPPKNSILYKYRWFKNKPKILSLENSHDEDLEIQSRDEGDPENEIMRKIKNISFFDKISSNGSSYLEDTLSDRDKITETSKNKITLIPEEKTKKIVDKIEENDERQKTNFKVKKDLEIHQISQKKNDQFQALKINGLPQVLTREENAIRKRKNHSIKNIQQTRESTYTNKIIEVKHIKHPIRIYLEILCIKQHIINIFSCLYKNFIDAESFIPLQMKIIRFIFLLVINMSFNIILLQENYFIKKYNYFNYKYNLEKSVEENLIISKIEIINYAFKHCFKNSCISLILCLIIQLIIGFSFFRTKKKIDNIIENKEKIKQNQELNKEISKIKKLFIIFFIVNFILILFFSIYNIGFNMVYNKSVLDFIIPTIITFIMLQIIPFIISILIAILIYLGLKKDNKKLTNIAKNFLF